MQKSKPKPRQTYVSVKMKPEEYQILVTAKEMLKLVGLDRLQEQGVPIPAPDNFDFTLGEMISIASGMMMMNMKAYTEIRDSGKVIDIEIYLWNKMPERLRKYSDKQGFTPKEGLVAVKTIGSTPIPSYHFENIGRTPEDIKKYMYKLAKEDGADLDKVVKNAFSEE